MKKISLAFYFEGNSTCNSISCISGAVRYCYLLLISNKDMCVVNKKDAFRIANTFQSILGKFYYSKILADIDKEENQLVFYMMKLLDKICFESAERISMMGKSVTKTKIFEIFEFREEIAEEFWETYFIENRCLLQLN